MRISEVWHVRLELTGLSRSAKASKESETGHYCRGAERLLLDHSSEASCASGLLGGETNVSSDLDRFAPSKGEQQIWIANVKHVVLAIPFHNRYASRVVGER